MTTYNASRQLTAPPFPRLGINHEYVTLSIDTMELTDLDNNERKAQERYLSQSYWVFAWILVLVPL